MILILLHAIVLDIGPLNAEGITMSVLMGPVATALTAISAATLTIAIIDVFVTWQCTR